MKWYWIKLQIDEIKVILLKVKEIIKYLKLGKISDDILSSDTIWINKGN